MPNSDITAGVVPLLALLIYLYYRSQRRGQEEGNQKSAGQLTGIDKAPVTETNKRSASSPNELIAAQWTEATKRLDSILALGGELGKQLEQSGEEINRLDPAAHSYQIKAWYMIEETQRRMTFAKHLWEESLALVRLLQFCARDMAEFQGRDMTAELPNLAQVEAGIIATGHELGFKQARILPVQGTSPEVKTGNDQPVSPEPPRHPQDEETFVKVNVNEAVDRFFDDSSIPSNSPPTWVLIMGGVATGKTYLRKQRFSRGYVLIDAGEIFLDLCKGQYYDFGAAFEQSMNIIGGLVANRAIRERRNIVTEMIGASYKEIEPIANAMRAIGYEGVVQCVTSGIEDALLRNRQRGINNISAVYTEAYHRRWLLEAAQESKPTQDITPVPAAVPPRSEHLHSTTNPTEAQG